MLRRCLVKLVKLPEDLEFNESGQVDIRSEKCQNCDKFVLKIFLKRHNLRHHVDKTAKTCRRCGAFFPEPQLLQTHLGSDTECLDEHIIGRKGPGVYFCWECGENFETTFLLSPHLRTMHFQKTPKNNNASGASNNSFTQSFWRSTRVQ